MRANKMFGSVAFVEPLNSSFLTIFFGDSSNITTSSTLNMTNALATCPAKYVHSSGDWAFSRIEPGKATDKV